MIAKAKNKKRLVLLDSHAIIHRAYHALPDFSSSKGEATGALYGLTTMLMGIIREFKPDYIIAAYDLPKKTYRHEAYADYKSGRKALDDNLIEQLKRSRDVFKAFNIPIYEKEGFEADDIIGTIVDKTKKKDDLEIIIASGDMDTLQLVEGKKVRVYTLKKGIKDTIIYDEKAVKERFGFKPKLLTDFKGLRGDPSDNIIGISGIGEKTATDLISNFGTIEEMYKKLEKDEKIFEKKGIKPRIINLLKENKEEAEFSKMLATIHTDAPVKIDFPKESWFEKLSSKKLRGLFSELEFRSLTTRLDEMFDENGEEEDEKDDSHKNIPEKEIKEVSVALWLLNSSITNPSLQDVFDFAKTDDFQKAKKTILDEIKKQGLDNLYEKIEKPLIKIVDKMKEDGICVDQKILKELSKEYHKKLSILEKEIWSLAGEEFNINSPKQMAEILFTKMNLSYKGMRKTSGGSYSTKEEVLQKLVEVHPIADKILQYRELQKLVSTYIDNLPNLIKEDGRLHATFIQTGAATGRMSSQDPNLQNIPIKSEYGRRIRHAFVAPKGKRLLAFDYSQIELRIAAILSGDEKLKEIFKKGEDVHSSVASHVFEVSLDEVTKEMRRKAKVINFGILYGMGVNALQKNLGTDRGEAQRFYEDYFKTFKTLAEYLDKTKASAARMGYTETLFSRRRYFEGIKSSLPFIRAQAERMAINAPIQGTQADIIKLSMVLIDKYLRDEKLENDVKLLLQIHDEIIYEVPEDLVEKLVPKIKEIMESAMKDKDTKGIPILADSSCGKNWGEMKEV